MEASERKRALVVDDDEGIRLMVCKILEHEGFAVEGARDGEAAIQKLAGSDYDFVVLDLMMPHTDGYEVIRYMKKERPESLSHVVVATALYPTGVEGDISRVLSKPFDVSRLLQFAREKSDGGDELPSDYGSEVAP